MEPTQQTRTNASHEPGMNGNGNGNGHGHAPNHDHDETVDLNVPSANPIWVALAGIGAVLVLGALLATGIIPRQKQSRELATDAADAAKAPVLVKFIKPVRASGDFEVPLPGTLRPWQEVSIFARTTGYMRKFYTDISEEVKQGQLMADVDTPEVDQQLNQAQANLKVGEAAVNTANTNLVLAKATYDRYTEAVKTHSVSDQDIDEKKAAWEAAQAQVESAKANVNADKAAVDRLKELQSFEKVTAPFDGVVTGRSYDTGALIVADPTNVDIKPMFKLAANDALRAFVNVPQSSSLQITKGMTVRVTARERPGRDFEGKVLGTTNYLDPTNRSLLTEVRIENKRDADGTRPLLPGMYIEAVFKVYRDNPPLKIPAPALINSADGTQVAINQDGKAHFVKVVLGQDYGSEIEVVGGLTGDEQVIANPGERIVEGVTISGGNPDATAAKPQETSPTKVSAAR